MLTSFEQWYTCLPYAVPGADDGLTQPLRVVGRTIIDNG
jgi:hypothetical protein